MKNKMTKLKEKIREYREFSNSKSATTYAGGLAYFFFAGLVPFIGIATAAVGLFGGNAEIIGELCGSEVIAAFFDLIAEEGGKKSGTIFMFVIAVYSSAHFYFHLIRTGENVYSSVRVRGVFNRIASFGYLMLVQILMIVAVGLEIAGKKVLLFLGFSSLVSDLLKISVSVAFRVALSVSLHLFAAPSGRKNLASAGKGAICTFVYWEVCGIFFSVYLAAADKADFGFATVAAFLLYVYYLMRGLICGMIVNATAFDGGAGDRRFDGCGNVASGGQNV